MPVHDVPSHSTAGKLPRSDFPGYRENACGLPAERLVDECIGPSIETLTSAINDQMSLPWLFRSVDQMCGSCRARLRHYTNTRFNCLNAVYKRFLQKAPANGFEDETEQVSFEVFTLACNHNVNAGGTVGITNKCVVMARGAPPIRWSL
jgi:hypothetical protein